MDNQEEPFNPYQVFEKPNLAGKGTAHNIWLISESHVSKTPKLVDRLRPGNYQESIYSLEKEFEVHTELYSRGFSVPKPYGLFSTKTRQGTHLGLTMEFIKGITPRWNDADINEIQNTLMREISLIHSQGIRTEDLGLYNTILSDEGKLYLIDFEYWKIER